MARTTGRVAFGEFELDLDIAELRRAGTVVKLQPQPATVLCLLVSEAGRLVGRDQIRHRVWGESTFVDYDVGLDYCVNRIRAVLGDEARSPRYIETLPRRGYRFIAPVKCQRPFAEPTLAVLPFDSLNGDPDTEYFADGVTAALIAELGRIPAVRVISRQSVLHLKGSRQTVEEIARDLAVDGVIEGSTLREANRVRVTVQLILADPERHAWTESYDCDMSAVLSSQREAARAIAAAVSGAVTPGRPAPLSPATAKPAAVSPQIVEAYLRGADELSRASADGLARALRHFREVTLGAPDFAPGLAGHAVCLYCLGWFGHAPALEVFPAAKQLALQAVALDEAVSGAHHALATMRWLLDGDIAAADAEYRRAIELSPSDADGRTTYALFLCGSGRYAESIAEARYALMLSPTALIQNQATAWALLHAGEYTEAERQATRTLDLFPEALQPRFVLGWALWRLERKDEAVAVFEQALASSREACSLAFLGHVYGRLGRAADAGRLLRETEALLADGHASPIALVIIHGGLGNLDEAMDWLERACRMRIDLVFLTKGFPGLDPLRSDPRFEEIVRRTGLPPAVL